MKHLLLDLYGCDPTLLADEEFLRRFLDEVPDRIEMQKVSPISLYYIDAVTNPDDAGQSGFVIIATSHASLHAWPPYRMVNIDVFSCEDFDENAVVAFACEAFGAQDREVKTVIRATRSPRPLRSG
jgi:S-adenosylmethionine decarboxylase